VKHHRGVLQPPLLLGPPPVNNVGRGVFVPATDAPTREWVPPHQKRKGPSQRSLIIFSPARAFSRQKLAPLRGASPRLQNPRGPPGKHRGLIRPGMGPQRFGRPWNPVMERETQVTRPRLSVPIPGAKVGTLVSNPKTSLT